MPVSVQSEKLIQELIQLKKGGCVICYCLQDCLDLWILSAIWNINVLCVVCQIRAQAYVGAFLRRTPEPAAESEADSVLGPLSTVVKPPKEAATELEDGSGDAAAHLHNIGTFAQVQLIPFCSCNQVCKSRLASQVNQGCTAGRAFPSSKCCTSCCVGAHHCTNGGRCTAAAAGAQAAAADSNGQSA